MCLQGLHTQLTRLRPHKGRWVFLFQSQFDYTGATPDAEYDLRFDADEEYVRELIDRIDEMSLRGVKLCNRCTEKHPGKWQGKPGKAQCAECDRNVQRHFVLQKGAAQGAEDEPLYRVKPEK